MNGPGRRQLTERFFRISVLLKGLNAMLEIVGGVMLFGVSPAFILRTVALLTQDELAEDPRDFIANYFLHAARYLSLSGQRFAAIYLLGHGVDGLESREVMDETGVNHAIRRVATMCKGLMSCDASHGAGRISKPYTVRWRMPGRFTTIRADRQN
jgi:hypothetical protein